MRSRQEQEQIPDVVMGPMERYVEENIHPLTLNRAFGLLLNGDLSQEQVVGYFYAFHKFIPLKTRELYHPELSEDDVARAMEPVGFVRDFEDFVQKRLTETTVVISEDSALTPLEKRIIELEKQPYQNAVSVIAKMHESELPQTANDNQPIDLSTEISNITALDDL